MPDPRHPEQPKRVWSRPGPLLLGLVLALVAGGCREPNAASEYEVLRGAVENHSADTFDLTIRVDKLEPDDDISETVSCSLLNAEIYIDDKFSNFEAIAIGDVVELIGYFKPSSPRGKRFIVTYAQIARNEPLPPAPDLSAPTTQPTSKPQES